VNCPVTMRRMLPTINHLARAARRLKGIGDPTRGVVLSCPVRNHDPGTSQVLNLAKACGLSSQLVHQRSCGLYPRRGTEPKLRQPEFHPVEDILVGIYDTSEVGQIVIRDGVARDQPHAQAIKRTLRAR